jgi:hydroxyacylglutathione hydrolase
LGAEVLGPGLPGVVDGMLRDGDSVETDAGSLVAVHTPGHTEDHLCFLWPERGALFAGDMFLGEGDTTWVAEYPGCVADYLDSLERLRRLGLRVIYPAHGPPLPDAEAALERFELHRRERVRQVEKALERMPGADADALVRFVYGEELPPGLAGAAAQSLSALVDYVKGVRRG